MLNPFVIPSLEKITNFVSRGGESLPSQRRIIFIVLNLFKYDAVSRHVIEMHHLLKELGVNTLIFSEGIGEDLRSIASPRDELWKSLQPDDLLFFEYSIWDPYVERLQTLSQQKVAFYQGITEPHLLASFMPDTARDCERGIQELWQLHRFDSVVCSSEHNRLQLLQAFQSKGLPAPSGEIPLFPPVLATEFFELVKSKKEIAPSKQLFYIGRFFPSKNLEKAIRVYQSLKELDPTYSLLLAGSGIYPPYLEMLKKEFVKEDPGIRFCFDVDYPTLKGFYETSIALLNFSLHEGFGVPLVEALQAQIPVITHSLTAIPQTLHGCGYYLDDPWTDADIQTLHQALTTGRSRILDQQNKVFHQFYREEVVLTRYRDLFARLLAKEGVAA